MINQKYYNDVKNFPLQFAKGMELAKGVVAPGVFEKALLCGMGGSSFYVGLINDILSLDKDIEIRVEAIKGYDMPLNSSKDTLYIISSYSGNTEEVIEFYNEVLSRGFSHVVVTSGGELEQLAKKNSSPLFTVPKGIQPRLSSGYFIAGVLQILTNCNLIPDLSSIVQEAADTIDGSLDEEKAKQMAKALVNFVPILYSTDNNSSLAQISKIKFNENSKIQAFWNFFPELNHNEMVGFTKLIMNPYIIIFKSQFTNPRNHKRIDVFKKLLNSKGVNVEVIDLKGRNVLEEILMGYYFVDHVTYYLAEEYGIDPEPVAMVEEFKNLLKV